MPPKAHSLSEPRRLVGFFSLTVVFPAALRMETSSSSTLAGVLDPITEDAFTFFAVGSYQNPGFNSGGQRELRFGLKFIF